MIRGKSSLKDSMGTNSWESQVESRVGWKGGIKKSFGIQGRRRLNWKIQETDRLEEEGFINIFLYSKRSQAKINLEELLFQEVVWRQKSKALWAKEGDNNTRMLHSIVNGRKNRNLIKKLESWERNSIEDDTGTEAKIIIYFSVSYSDGGFSRPLIEGLN